MFPRLLYIIVSLLVGVLAFPCSPSRSAAQDAPEALPAPRLPALGQPQGEGWAEAPARDPLEVARFHDAQRDVTLTLTVVDVLASTTGATPQAVVDDWDAQLRESDPRVVTLARHARVVNGVQGVEATLAFGGRSARYWGFVVQDDQLGRARLACFVFVEGPRQHAEPLDAAFEAALSSLSIPGARDPGAGKIDPLEWRGQTTPSAAKRIGRESGSRQERKERRERQHPAHPARHDRPAVPLL